MGGGRVSCWSGTALSGPSSERLSSSFTMRSMSSLSSAPGYKSLSNESGVEMSNYPNYVTVNNTLIDIPRAEDDPPALIVAAVAAISAAAAESSDHSHFADGTLRSTKCKMEEGGP